MNRLSPFGEKYKSSQRQELATAGTEQGQTGEKQNKYYSSQDYDGTIRKRLIDQYPQIRQEQEHKIYQNKAQELATSTKYSHSSKQKTNEKLIQRLQGSLNAYEPKFIHKNTLRKIEFSVLDLEDENDRQKQLITNRKKEIPKQPEIATKIEKERLIQEGEKLIQDMMPKRRVSHIDRQIAALYKQNRNVNLEYRRDKFMQIFVGTSKFAKGTNSPFI